MVAELNRPGHASLSPDVAGLLSNQDKLSLFSGDRAEASCKILHSEARGCRTLPVIVFAEADRHFHCEEQQRSDDESH